MLTIHRDQDGAIRSAASGDLPAGVIWIDLLDPTDDERAFVERRAGFRLPLRDAAGRIEASSRLIDEAGVLYMATPLVSRGQASELHGSPASFILSARLLVTIRYAAIPCFDAVADQIRRAADLTTSAGVFTALIEQIVDLGAEVIEDLGSQIDQISHLVFRGDSSSPGHAVRSTEMLRDTLSVIGRIGEGVGRVRDMLLGVGRMDEFAHEAVHGWMLPAWRSRLEALSRDIASLNAYEEHLASKVQFLLDAVLGYITVEQNNLFRVLTIVAVAGVPPTLLAAIWGMNFAAMPELQQPWGYPAALAAIALSAAAPLLWFRMRGWF